MGNAPHMKASHWLLQWFCGVFWHQDRNYADRTRHYSYCIRCGYLFWHPWKTHTWQQDVFDAEYYGEPASAAAIEKAEIEQRAEAAPRRGACDTAIKPEPRVGECPTAASAHQNAAAQERKP